MTERLIGDNLPERKRARSKTPKRHTAIRVHEFTYREISKAADYSGRNFTEMLMTAWECYKAQQIERGRWPPSPDHGRFDEADHISRDNIRRKLAEAEAERHRLKDHPFWGTIKK
jgi:hypothetical protein